MITEQTIQEALATYRDPYTGQTLIEAKAIKRISIDLPQIVVDVVWAYPVFDIMDDIQAKLTRLLLALPGVDSGKVNIATVVRRHKVQNNIPTLPLIKNVIAIASGKGGVGKSTTTVNLAVALARDGARVGILDADIYGPNQPQMLGGGRVSPQSKDKKTLEPVVCHGVQSMSIGYLLESNKQPMIWRGPMVSGALQQLLRDTNWQDLDYLFLDLPPGTGDIQLTMSQKVPVSAGVIVTTPQDVALLDAQKGLAMFRKVNIPVLGVIENMGMHVCSKCGHHDAIFSEGGGKRLAGEYDVPLLASLPLDRRIREQADAGRPIVVHEPDGDIAQIYRDAARRLVAGLSLQAKDYGLKMPKVVVKGA